MKIICKWDTCLTVSLVEHVFHLGNILHFGKDSCQASSWGLIFCFLMNSINPNELSFIFQTVIGVDHNGYHWATMETTILFWASKFWSCFKFVPKHDLSLMWSPYPAVPMRWCSDIGDLELNYSAIAVCVCLSPVARHINSNSRVFENICLSTSYFACFSPTCTYSGKFYVANLI